MSFVIVLSRQNGNFLWKQCLFKANQQFRITVVANASIANIQYIFVKGFVCCVCVALIKLIFPKRMSTNGKRVTQMINGIEMSRSGSKNDTDLVKCVFFSVVIIIVILVSNQNKIFLSTLDNRVNKRYKNAKAISFPFSSTCTPRAKYASNNKIMEELNIKQPLGKLKCLHDGNGERNSNMNSKGSQKRRREKKVRKRKNNSTE